MLFKIIYLKAFQRQACSKYTIHFTFSSIFTHLFSSVSSSRGHFATGSRTNLDSLLFTQYFLVWAKFSISPLQLLYLFCTSKPCHSRKAYFVRVSITLIHSVLWFHGLQILFPHYFVIFFRGSNTSLYVLGGDSTALYTGVQQILWNKSMIFFSGS